MSDVSGKVEEAVRYIRSASPLVPCGALILGSGLGALVRQMEVEAELPFRSIPHLAAATALGHTGSLVMGNFAGIAVAAMRGRLHAYEGHAPSEIAFPVRVMRALGAQSLVVTNAAGGLNPAYRVGDVVVIDDQIDLTFRDPSVGGPRYQPERAGLDRSWPYDARLGDAAQAAARRCGFECCRGVYVGMLGPTFETRAEYRMLRRLGGDMVGMSTVGEVMVARTMRMRVVGLSVISNVCSPDTLGETSGEEVLSAVGRAVPRVGQIVADLLRGAE
jgi:purine-nucleoside phosphorylase